MTVTTATPVSVRLADWADVPAIVAIERASFSDPWTAESFRSALALERMRVLVAESPGEGDPGVSSVVGYVLALLIGDEAEIADLAVVPSARRRGVGRILLDRMLLDIAAQGVRAVYLEVRESNAAARSLYESHGFRGVGRRRGYYRHPPEDALLLKREIGPR